MTQAESRKNESVKVEWHNSASWKYESLKLGDNSDYVKGMYTWHPEFQKIWGMKFEESALVPCRE